MSFLRTFLAIPKWACLASFAHVSCASIVLISFAVGCRHEASFPPLTARDPDYQTTLRIRFLGVGGFLIERAADSVLTAPLYSNPPQVQLLNDEFIPPNHDAIRRFHPKTPNVKAILVGHAHYDHLMDVPYVWLRSPQATIYGNLSTKHILMGYRDSNDGAFRSLPDRIVALNAVSAVDHRMCETHGGAIAHKHCRTIDGPGRWMPVDNSRVRLRPICSKHPAQIISLFHLWGDCIASPRTTSPMVPSDYQEGDTLAFLIDFLDPEKEEPIFRIYYQDAPTPPPLGQVAPELVDSRRVDVALLCAGNFNDVPDPGHIVRNLRPRYVILGHWENFFRMQDKPAVPLPLLRLNKIIDTIAETVPEDKIFVPEPQKEFRFRLVDETVTIVERP